MQRIHDGSGTTRDVILVHDVRDSTNKHLRVAAPHAAIGVDNILPRNAELRQRDRRRFSIVGNGGEDGILDMQGAVAAVHKGDAKWSPGRIVCVGFGEGSKAADAWFKHGDKPSAVVSIEGWRDGREHAGRKSFIKDAHDGKRVLVLAHAHRSEVEAGPRAYIEKITKWNLGDGGPLDAPAEQREGGLVVVSYSLDWREMRACEELITGFCVALAMATLDSLRPARKAKKAAQPGGAAVSLSVDEQRASRRSKSTMSSSSRMT